MSEAKAQAQRSLPPENLNEFAQVSTTWDVMIPKDVPIEALLDPAYWAHRAMKLKPMDEMRARAEDGTWVARLIVLDCSRTWARLKVLDKWTLTTGDVALTQASAEEVKALADKHKVIHRSQHKWSVVRIADGAVLHAGEAAREGAEAWLDAFVRQTVGANAPAPKQTAPA